MERGKRVVRLSEYIYLLLHRGRLEDSVENGEVATTTAPGPALTTASPRPSGRGATQWSAAYTRPLLCQPVMLQWRRDVMVHFVVPGELLVMGVTGGVIRISLFSGWPAGGDSIRRHQPGNQGCPVTSFLVNMQDTP